MWPRAVSLVNAAVLADGGRAQTLRFGSTVLAIDEPPHRGDRVIDLEGAFVLPGLVNAHDHLELNHYGRIKFRERHANVSEWIDDMRPHLRGHAAIRAAQSHSLASRLFVGGLKNLLAGTTTVAHHNPFYRELRLGFPIRVVRRYGWAHSFQLEREPAGARGELGGDVADRCRSTPKGAPFFVHLAEGVDDAAVQELARFEALGCLGPNVIFVHGVGIDPDAWRRVSASGAGLVWCPASNEFLFGQTAPIGRFARDRIALGTDSRLSGARDLLDELRVAASTGAASPEELLAMVTGIAADLIGQPAGRLRVGAAADLVVIPRLAETAASSLLAASRADVSLVVVGGRPLVGDRSRADVFDARGITPHRIRVDAAPKLADPALARRIAECPIVEPGVEAA